MLNRLVGGLSDFPHHLSGSGTLPYEVRSSNHLFKFQLSSIKSSLKSHNIFSSCPTDYEYYSFTGGDFSVCVYVCVYMCVSLCVLLLDNFDGMHIMHL